MNETMNLLLNRYSLRNFSEEKIDPQIVKEILDAGVHAATAGNLQPVSIIKIEDPKNSQWFVEQGMQSFIGKAPLNLIFCLDFYRLKKWSEYYHAPYVADKSFRHFWVSFQDVVIAAQSIETAARSYGIGSVYIGTTVDMIKEIKEKFKLPQGVVPVVLLTLGYPKSKQKPTNKLSQDIMVHNEEYQLPTTETIEIEFEKKYGKPKTEMTPERRQAILDMILEVDGEAALAEAKPYFETKKFIDAPIRYFVFHYVANLMASDNTDLLKILADDGLIWAGLKNYPEKNN